MTAENLLRDGGLESEDGWTNASTGSGSAAARTTITNDENRRHGTGGLNLYLPDGAGSGDAAAISPPRNAHRRGDLHPLGLLLRQLPPALDQRRAAGGRRAGRRRGADRPADGCPPVLRHRKRLAARDRHVHGPGGVLPHRLPHERLHGHGLTSTISSWSRRRPPPPITSCRTPRSNSAMRAGTCRAVPAAAAETKFGAKAMTMQGSYNGILHVSQPVALNCSSDTTFLLSGWAQADYAARTPPWNLTAARATSA